MTVIAGRIAASILMLFAVSVLPFSVLELAPGDFFAEMQADARIGSQTVDGLRAQYGLTESPVVRYWQWLRSFVQGDLGFSLAHRAPVSSVIWTRAGNTLLLTIPAILVTWCLALPLGVWIARYRNRWIDRVSSGVTSTLVALPDLLVALLLLLLALRTGLFPTGGMYSPGAAELGFGARQAFLVAHQKLASPLHGAGRHQTRNDLVPINLARLHDLRRQQFQTRVLKEGLGHFARESLLHHLGDGILHPLAGCRTCQQEHRY